MLHEPPELVGMRLALGQQLAARREAAGIIQQQIARKTGYSRPSVARAESGRQLLTREFWQTADELLQADGALRAGYEQVRSAKEEHEARSREAELAPDESGQGCRGRLQPWRDTPAVRTLDEQLTGMGFHA
jgi:transcriptional regulator with XRE-family HTH domain